MYLSGLGYEDPDIAIPIVGSDYVTTGLSPSTMHVDPVSGLPEASAVAPGTTVVVAAAPAASGSGSLWLIAALALGAWYGYEHGWFAGLLDQFETKAKGATIHEG